MDTGRIVFPVRTFVAGRERYWHQLIRCANSAAGLMRHLLQCDQLLRVILAWMRHEHGGGWAARAELRTGTKAASSGPVRRIVLRG
jgi:hypothetical protein